MTEVSTLNFLLLTVSGWVNRRQLKVIEYLREENRVLREHLGTKRVRFSDSQRRRLGEKGKALGRKKLRDALVHNCEIESRVVVFQQVGGSR